MKIVVLGGQGFIGKNLVKAFALENEVTVLDKAVMQADKVANCRYVTCDFLQIRNHMEALKNADVLYHLISTTNPITSSRNMAFDIETNLLGTVSLLKASVEAGVKRIIFPSSGGTVYGNPIYSPLDEAHPTNPISPYGITKLAIEKYIQMFYRTEGLDYTIFRIANAYGPHHAAATQGVINVFLKKALNGDPIEIWGDGETVRDYIYVDDVVDVMIRAARENHPDKLFNLGSNKGYSINQILRAIEDVTGTIPGVTYTEGQRHDVASNVLDCSRIKKAYGFTPRVSLWEGIRRITEASEAAT